MCREMKTCSIKWFGKIPGEWKIVKVKQLFNIGRGRVIAQTELDDNAIYPVYSSQTKNNGCLGYINTYDFDKKQLTWTTDGANAGTVFLRTGKYNCTNVCGTLLPKNEENNLEYLKYILEYTAIFHKRADTNGFKIMNNEMAEISILLPNKVEQDKIAGYLNRKVSQIDDIISKQKSLIEKYKDYKQSLITETVTKGLNKNFPMNDSEIEWIGEIPSHWNIEKGKHILTLLSREVNENDEVITCFRDGEVTLRSNRREDGFTFADKEIGYQGIEPGDLVIHGMDGFAGAIGISDSRGKASPVLNVCDTKENKRYIMYYLRRLAYNNVFLALATGIRVRSCDLRWNKIGSLLYPIPPKEEQDLIVDYLDNILIKIDSLIQIKQSYIEKLEAYKKSLIYECVTGKREVN